MSKASLHRCPACGALLDFAPWNGRSPSDEICPCCGIQFGYDDAAGGDAGKQQDVYDTWRQHWVEGGMRWMSKSRAAPADWNPREQLKEIGVTFD